MVHKHSRTIVMAVLLMGLVAGSFFAGRAITGTSHVSAQSISDASALDGTNAVFTCNVINVAAFDTRIHVQCNPASGAISYFAYASDPAHASTSNRMLAVANTALALGKTLQVYYNTDSTKNPSGCDVSDCRGLWGVLVVK